MHRQGECLTWLITWAFLTAFNLNLTHAFCLSKDYLDYLSSTILNAIFLIMIIYFKGIKELTLLLSVLVNHVDSLIDTRILCSTVEKSCINHHIIAYKILNNCLLFIFQQTLIKNCEAKGWSEGCCRRFLSTVPSV